LKPDVRRSWEVAAGREKSLCTELAPGDEEDAEEEGTIPPMVEL
jgi:hypothetical protein